VSFAASGRSLLTVKHDMDATKAPRSHMKEAKFEVFFLEELEDLYDAEQQIVEALPK
jgi:hypothetical protein